MKYLKYSLFLAVVCGICGGLLVFVNLLTKPKIENAEDETTYKLLEEIIEGNWTNVTEQYQKTLNDRIINLYELDNMSYIGYKTITKGYNGGDICLLVVINISLQKIINVRVVYLIDQTKDIGTKIALESYLNLYSDKEISFFANKNISDYDDSDGLIITGATISSSAVIQGVINVANHFEVNFNEKR